MVKQRNTKDEDANSVPELSTETPTLFETVTPEQLRQLQKEDPTLATVHKKADSGAGLFLWKEGLLMQESYNLGGKRLLMVPKNMHTQVLRLAHTSSTEKHFGQARTIDALRTRLDWPGFAKDVQDMCCLCPVCQKTAPAVVMRAPIPFTDHQDPFQQDCYGHLWTYSADIFRKYVLVMVDYESNLPEAYTLHSMTSKL